MRCIGIFLIRGQLILFVLCFTGLLYAEHERASITHPLSLGEVVPQPACPPEEKVFPVYRDIDRAEELIARELVKPPEHMKDMVGVCFSGGGSRSLSLVRGELAALVFLDYWHRINYLSVVSGAAWAVIPYLSLASKHKQDTFLGEVVREPQLLELNDRDYEAASNIAWLHKNSLGNTPQGLDLVDVIKRFGLGGLSPDVWSDLLADVLLKPYNIDPENIVSEKLFPLKPDHMQLIVNAGLVNEEGSVLPFEITPVAMGNRKSPLSSLGGYMVPPAGFGCELHWGEEPECIWQEKTGFRIKDVLGVTSSNFYNMWPDVWDGLSRMGMGIPRYNYPKADFEQGISVDSEHPIIDIGWREYLGLMPLLVRKQSKIIAFINTDIPLVRSLSSETGQIIGMEKVISTYFGVMPDVKAEKKTYQTFKDAESEGSCNPYCSMNYVFPHHRYQELAEGLWKAKQAGEPVVFLQKELPVTANSVYGVEGGWQVDILWVYNDLSWNWYKALKPELQNMMVHDKRFIAHPKHDDVSVWRVDNLEGGSPASWYWSRLLQSELQGLEVQNEQYVAKSASAMRFPHFKAVSEMNLDAVQVNLLFHHAVWTLLNSQAKLSQLLD